MGQRNVFNLFAALSITVFVGLLAGCMEKELYDPDGGKELLPDPNGYFGFETCGDIAFSVNYGLPGFTTLLEVYDEDPMEIVDNTPVKKKGVEALFKIYTDDNGKYEGKMNIPTAVSSIYLYTETWGLPRCVQLDIKDGQASFDMTTPQTYPKQKTSVRSYSFSGTMPYVIDKGTNLFSLCRWGWLGNLDYFADYEKHIFEDNINPGYITPVRQVGDESIGEFVKRMMQFFGKNTDNSNLVRKSGTTNVSVQKDGTTLDVVFVNRNAQYNNTFGYYYYKTGEDVDPAKVKKYIIFPDVALEGSNGYVNILTCGDKVRLLYFDEDGKVCQTFPKGYTVGWFIYADGYVYNESSQRVDHQDEINISKLLLTSNIAKTDMQRFITVDDKASGKVIIGVEDGGNNSYYDLLFYVDASPKDAIDDPERPVTDPDEDKKPEQDAVENHNGILAFEDIWPNGGDYDMNDVVVKYNRAVYFNSKNRVNKIVDTFTPVNDGATFKNAFAYQIDKEQFGELAATDGIRVESETSSIIVCPNVKEVIGKTYTIKREFDTNSSFDKNNLSLYNPFIIVNYEVGSKTRTEVHLPKYKATSFVDMSLIGSGKDAYYIDRDGAYPFAIDIPKTDFTPVTETHRIDSEYPDFTQWANSSGSAHTDWYMNRVIPK